MPNSQVMQPLENIIILILTRTLQILFIFVLGLILVFWLGDVFIGIPVDVSDQAISKGWAEDYEKYEAAKRKARITTLLYALPTISLLIITIKSIKQKSTELFYWTFLAGLTFFQILPVAGLLKGKGQKPQFIFLSLVIFFVLFASGQIFSIYRIIKVRRTKY